MLAANFSGWFIVIGSASFVVILIFFFLLFIQYSRRKMQHMKEVLRLQQNFEQTLLQSQLEIQEQVFQNISYEIHDNIGQILSLVRLNLNTLGEVKDSQKLQTTDELLERAIEDLRSLSHNLNAKYICEIGLTASLHKLLENLEKTGRYTASFESSVEEVELPDEQSIILFRIAQEIINNIVKHSKATKVSVKLVGYGSLDAIIISDNGIGFDAQKQHSGIGLSTIANRAKTIGANVIFNSNATGTEVTIQLHDNA